MENVRRRRRVVEAKCRWARRVYFACGEVGRVSLLRRKTSHYVPYARKKKTDILSDVRFFLVGAKGLEPLTSCV